MRLHIRHDTIYRYADAASMVIQALRMWPAPCAGQHVDAWQVSIDGRAVEPSCRDGFGNPVATHTIDRDVHAVHLAVRGEVETRDLGGILGEDAGGLPPCFYLAETALTATSPEIVALARGAHGEGSPLDAAHRLSNLVRDRVEYRPDSTHAGTTAAEALAAGTGVCQDHAHVLVAVARAAGIPARYVSGYLCPAGEEAAASHAWAELHVEPLGWIGFDAANRQCPDERYVRIACGRDYRDAAPVRGVRLGGTAESLEVDVTVTEGAQSQ